MMAPHTAKTLFVHVPKTGGCSIADIQSNVGFRYIGHDITDPNFVYLKDRKELIANNYVFAFVRNPFDRVLSAYSYLSQQEKPSSSFYWDYINYADALRYNIFKYENFNAFIQSEFVKGDVLNQVHFMPQYKWICDDNNKLLTDYLGRFEKYDESLDILTSLTGLHFTPRIHRNSSTHDQYRSYYDEKSIDIVKNVYSMDLEYFKYEF